MKIIDISQEILSCKVYPGDPVPGYERLVSMDKGDVYNMSAFSMCAHNGTHVDAPFHFINDGNTIENIPLESFVGLCYVARHNGEVTADDAAEIMEKAVNNGAAERILIAGNAVVTAEAAEVFADHNIKLIGNESQSVGPENAPMKVHKILLSKEIVLLEGVVLNNVNEGKYFLSALPLNIKGFDGSPCRAYLIEL
ncbi:MAG: cyclase family protein [Clostridia bacterium]|nr:cyclase family protein [Clostridia bacterium]